MLGIAMGLGPAACVADPLLPCDSFESGEAARNTLVRADEGPIAVVATSDPFLLRKLCDDGECWVDKLPLEELSAGSQVMLTTRGHFVVGIDREESSIWTYTLDDSGRRTDKGQSYVDEDKGPAKLVIGLRDSDSLIVRDRQGQLSVYEPDATVAIPIAPELGDYTRLAAVGHQHVVVKVPHAEGKQTLYLVDLGDEDDDGPSVRDPKRPVKLATGDFTSVVIGPDDASLVISEGRGTEASVLVFDVASTTLVDAFEGEVVSARQENQRRALEELPGLHALSPSGEQLAYRTTAGSLAVRQLGEQSSCLVRNTNRLGTDREPTRRVGDHAAAGFSADGIIYAEYTVGAAESYVYAYDPRGQQLVPLGAEDGGWHLGAVPGRVTSPDGEPEQLWAVGVRGGSHATIGEGGVDGDTVGRELTFMPREDDGVWAIDTDDSMIVNSRNHRALSVRRVDPPRWASGRLRFEQAPDDQVVDHVDHNDNEGKMRVPLSGRLCLSTGVPGAWAFHCGDSSGGRNAITTNSGTQEQNDDPNARPEFDPPFPDEDDEPSDG